MIKNQLQYKVTISQKKKFEEAILRAQQTKEVPEGTHPLMWKAQIDALKSQYETLNRQVKEYEYLISGQVKNIEIETLEDFPIGLIKARIVKGLTQKELAEIIEVKPQQIQRWEDEEYYKAKFDQLIKIANALGVHVSERISFEKEAGSHIKSLKRIGIDIEFIKRRLCRSTIEEPALVLLEASDFLKRIWGLTLHDSSIVKHGDFSWDGIRHARFKLPANADNERVRAYAQYAYTVANIVASSAETEISEVPQNWETVRDAIDKRGGLNLKSCLHYAWDLGIPVIPLSDSIRFHGGCWRINGRNSIVLKQSNREESRWLFDLLHEIYHASDHTSTLQFPPLDLEGTDPERREAEEELLANEFAGNVLLNGNATAYFEEVLRTSSRRIPLFKKGVQTVAEKHKVNVGVLANYVAFRLKKDFHIDWWGAASNLQSGDADAYSLTQEVFLERCEFSSMTDLDRQIVELAITEPSI
jgi:Zn-dependent peptidase ImmA (M78 family)/ribosome-binding protein aMBF1 (putative translation factor)